MTHRPNYYAELTQRVERPASPQLLDHYRRQVDEQWELRQAVAESHMSCGCIDECLKP